MGHLLLRGGRVVDPRNGVDKQNDLRIEGEQITEAGLCSKPYGAEEIDCSGKVIVPGLIDMHVHLSRYFGGPMGHRMVARTGVTTCLDLAGVLDDLVTGFHDMGAGLTVGYLFPLIPGNTLTSANPSRAELQNTIAQALSVGALGIKLLGGHYPLTPEATAMAIRIANEQGTYIAFHAGTIRTGSNILGLEEAIQLANGGPIHIAHVNSYCRGQVLSDPLAEAQKALTLLEVARNVRSESYLSILNGTVGDCERGIPCSHVTRTCLRAQRYQETQEGLEHAILDKYCLVQYPEKDEIQLVAGEEGLRLFRARQTIVGVSFPVNSPLCQFLLATAKRAGRFAVDAISTDGGAIPRNVLVTAGLALVRLGALSLSDLVTKVSWHPALMLGMSSKGHLGVGADADVTVLDLDCGRACLSIASGRIIMKDGIVVGKEGILLTTKVGREVAAGTRLTCRILQ